MRTDDAAAAFHSSPDTRRGVKGRVTPEVIGRSGQRATIVNETHRSHQMLTFDWRRRSGEEAGCVLSATPGVQRSARPRDGACEAANADIFLDIRVVLLRRSCYRPRAFLFLEGSRQI